MHDSPGLLGQLALNRGSLAPAQLDECLREQQSLRAAGESVMIGQLFVRRGFLRDDDVGALLAEQEKLREAPPPMERYEVRRRIGEGAAAIVYEAWDRPLKRPVAIKVLRPYLARGSTTRDRFLREAQMAAGLSHPNVVPVYDVGESDGRLYIVMEFVDGTSLARALAPLRQDLPKLMETLERAARGVAAAHAKGIVHRDLKPANILIATTGEPKVGDFGLARPEDGESRMTQTGATLGTPSYMAPEQVRGRDITTRTDVYALGVILYESLTGRLPHAGDSAGEVFARILSEEVVAPRSIDSAVPAGLEAVALKALSKDPRFRYASASEFADDVGRWRRGEPVLARQARASRGTLLSIAVAAVLALVAVMFWLTAPPRRDPVTPRNPDAANDAEGESRLRLRLAALESTVKEARPLFFARNLDIQEKLRSVDAAVDELTGLARVPVNDRRPDLWALVGVGRYFLGDHRRAEEALARALERGSTDGWVHYYLGRICLEQSLEGRLVAVTLPPQENSRLLALSRRAAESMARSIDAGIGADEVDRAVAEACRLFAEDRRPEALKKCDGGLSAHGGKMGAEVFWLIRGWLILPDFEAAEQAFSQAIECRPHDALAHLLRAVARLAQGRPADAIADLDKALQVNPFLVPAYNNRAHIRIKAGDTASALADLNAGLRVAPDRPELLCNRARVFLMLSDPDSALRDAGEAIRHSPGFPIAWLQRGSARQLRGEFQQALDDYAQAIACDPRCADARLNRGTVFRAMKRFPEAVAEFETALRVAPRTWDYRGLAQAGLEMARAGK